MFSEFAALGNNEGKHSGVYFLDWDTTTNTWDIDINVKYYYSPFIVPILNDHPLISNNATGPFTVQGNQTGSSLTFTNHSGSDIDVAIYSLNGKRAKRVVVPETGLAIDISFLSSGVYFIEYFDRNTASVITSFLKW